jgi:hypothetical protein
VSSVTLPPHHQTVFFSERGLVYADSADCLLAGGKTLNGTNEKKKNIIAHGVGSSIGDTSIVAVAVFNVSYAVLVPPFPMIPFPSFLSPSGGTSVVVACSEFLFDPPLSAVFQEYQMRVLYVQAKLQRYIEEQNEELHKRISYVLYSPNATRNNKNIK